MKYIVAFLLLCGTTFGQIEVPAEIDAYKPIVAKVTSNIPAGATFNGGWEVSGEIDCIEIPGGTIHLWCKPGSYELKYTGYWVNTESVTFTDGSGKEITIQSFLGSGFINETATFKVLGSDPEPEPEPPQPVVEKKYQLMFFIAANELDKMPAKQKYLVTSLKVRKDLEELGHVFKEIIDDDQITNNAPSEYAAWIKAVQGKNLPRLAYAPVSGGEILDIDMPNNYEELLAVLSE